jgi:hypothetical protein
VLSGLSVTQKASTANGQQCFASETVDIDGDTSPLVDGGTITFTETFASSFKTRTTNGTASGPLDQNLPGAIYNTESAFYDVNSGNTLGLQHIAGSAPAGLADFGTRFRVIFTNLQAGITVTAPNEVHMNSSTGELCMTATESGPYSAVGACTGTSTFTATASSNTVEYVYEVVAAETGVTENAIVQFFFNWSGPPHQPALGTNNIVGWFAPTPIAPPDPTIAQPVGVPIPRFVDFSTPIADLTIVKCATHLLFPFVTDMGGFDTGLAISNTSTDPYGTTPQSGTCTLSFFGDNAPSACITTGQSGCSSTGGPDIPSGTTWASSVFGLNFLNFQGYVIADCEFQYAHGFAFVTKVGTTDLAMGYLALIIPDPPTPNNRQPSPFTIKGANSGEQLGY